MKLCSLVLCFIYLGYCLDMKHLRSRSLDEKMSKMKHLQSRSLEYGKGQKSYTLQAEEKKLKTPALIDHVNKILIQDQKVFDHNNTWDGFWTHLTYRTCQNKKWDEQGCVTCFHNHKCKDGWTYLTYRNCGWWNLGCQSQCLSNYQSTYRWPCDDCGRGCVRNYMGSAYKIVPDGANPSSKIANPSCISCFGVYPPIPL